MKMRAPRATASTPHDFVFGVGRCNRYPAQCATFSGALAGNGFAESRLLCNSYIV